MSIIVLVLFVSTGPAVRLARGMGFLEMIAAMFFCDTHPDSAYARLSEMLASKAGVEGEGKS